MSCSWCSAPATWMLLADADLQHHDHPACDEHHEVWGRLYRRAVPMPAETVVDLREDDGEVDVRTEDEPTGRHER